ncbi:hypothetical protein VE01_07755 [Pseudogymnoascus verrucosus]|uniref:Zn(2)-C6 fungal-type domain-containing protein n=1 Tax=Pseudogymnoascus verrucosus TaxID=342668 RepID=A0A1B8GF00_9PEZI|nr:uncharacterized protein VE01_07755 [Pseudogymnoascus verrucosus]OBT94406.1 hypothetical protein VE01_07755 [Pseudogymnoascus verrucosus]
MNVEGRQTHRQRLRIACDPCRERKRKCDGGRPCNICLGYGYDCSYRSTPRNRQPQRGAGRSQTVITREASPSVPAGILPQRLERQQQYNLPSGRCQRQHQHPQQGQEQQAQEHQDPDGYLRSAESNSGAAFARLLTITLESSDRSVSPMRMLAWNLFLGERQTAGPVHQETLPAVLSELEMRHLATVYFEKVHPCYGFIGKDMLLRSISSTWDGQGSSSAEDALLCGVVALACLFSSTQDLAAELSLVALAKRLLDPSTADPPSLHSATAWLLRTVYLRLTAKPEEAWLASCTTLHIIDAAGLMSRADHGSAFSLPQDPRDVHLRRRVFGVAQHLNTWMSYDLGRNRVLVPNADTVPPSAQPGEYTTELLDLLPYSQDLDPANGLSMGSLVAALVEVLDRTHTEPPSVLAQCNLMLCIHRRLHSSKLEVPDDVMNKVLGLIKNSIQAVRSSVAAGLPWHHVANIPFQAICTLLVIDTVQSFALLNESLACVIAVNDAYQTEATREAATAACTLLQLHQKRREADIKKHSDMLSMYPSVDFPLRDSHGGPLNGYDLQNSWWFSEFVAHSDLALGVTPLMQTP